MPRGHRHRIHNNKTCSSVHNEGIANDTGEVGRIFPRARLPNLVISPRFYCNTIVDTPKIRLRTSAARPSPIATSGVPSRWGDVNLLRGHGLPDYVAFEVEDFIDDPWGAFDDSNNESRQNQTSAATSLHNSDENWLRYGGSLSHLPRKFNNRSEADMKLDSLKSNISKSIEISMSGYTISSAGKETFQKDCSWEDVLSEDILHKIRVWRMHDGDSSNLLKESPTSYSDYNSQSSNTLYGVRHRRRRNK